MKLKLTKTEAKSLVLKALGLPEDTKVVIVDDSIPRYVPDKLAALILEIEKMDYNYSQKIMAIKRFREVVVSGLVQAKWAIEHWEQVKNFIIKNRRVPEFIGENSNYVLK